MPQPRLFAALALVLTVSGAAVAQEPPAPQKLKVIPLRPVAFAPGPKEFAWTGGPGPYYPDRAAFRQIAGQVVLDCLAAGDGSLDDCKVSTETPAGFGFGAAALTMAGKRFMTAAPVEGAPPVGGREMFVVNFKAGEKPCPPGSRQRHC